MRKQRSKVIVLVGSAPNRRRVGTLLCWIRALVPAAVLVSSPVEALTRDVLEDAITLNVDEIPSGPLSLADALARATATSPHRGGG